MYFWVEWRTPGIGNGPWQESKQFDTRAEAEHEADRLRDTYSEDGEYIVHCYEPFVSDC